MRSIRLFVSEPIEVNKTFYLEDQAQCHYLLNVLRIKPNQILVLFNGNTYDFKCEILAIDKKKITLKPYESVQRLTESPLHITLAQVLGKQKKMDLIIEKAVELGVNEIYPLISSRCDVKLKDLNRLQKKTRHFQDIAIAACQQSNRSVIPVIHPIMSLTDYSDLPEESAVSKILFTPKNPLSISLNDFTLDLLGAAKKVSIMIGPEGGFDDNEITDLTKKGVFNVTLGPRILRMETAGLVAISILQYKFGDLY